MPCGKCAAFALLNEVSKLSKKPISVVAKWRKLTKLIRAEVPTVPQFAMTCCLYRCLTVLCVCLCYIFCSLRERDRDSLDSFTFSHTHFSQWSCEFFAQFQLLANDFGLTIMPFIILSNILVQLCVVVAPQLQLHPSRGSSVHSICTLQQPKAAFVACLFNKFFAFCKERRTEEGKHHKCFASQFCWLIKDAVFLALWSDICMHLTSH